MFWIAIINLLFFIYLLIRLDKLETRICLDRTQWQATRADLELLKMGFNTGSK